MKIVFFVFISFISLFLYAGSIQAEDSPELRRSSLVIVAQPEFAIRSQHRFSWADKHADVSGALKKSDFSVQQLIDTAITNTLQAKGYQMVKKSDANLLIQYHVSLESEMDDTALAIHYGLAPGLRANSDASKQHERGTLIVDLVDPKLGKVVWRGAIGVFTGVENTDTGRQKRVNALLVELFGSIPAKN